MGGSNSFKTMSKSFDMYMKRPEEMTAYLSRHGWHFSKKAYLFAANKMVVRGKEERVKPYTYDEVEEMMKRHNVVLKNDNGYDKVYIASMCRADYFGSSIEDESHIAKFIKDFIDDTDGSDEKAMRHFYCDMISLGVDIPWEELL